MSIRFVANPLGHGSAALKLVIYAHLLPVEIGDMGFAEFGRPPGVTKRHYTPPSKSDANLEESLKLVSRWSATEKLEREAPFAPAPLGSGSLRRAKK
jgi:hypothetical protein